MPAALSLETDFDNRFWYWRGASGRRYIHSVYAGRACPPLPGAVYVAVNRAGGRRIATGLGRFAANWDLAQMQAIDAFGGADEVHVHLLAGGDDEAARIVADLAAGLGLAVPAMDNRLRGEVRPAGRNAGGLGDAGLPLFEFTAGPATPVPA